MKIKFSFMMITLMVISFSSRSQTMETFTDTRDGKVYKTVTIGTQSWMAENLAYKATSGCLAYNNDAANVNKYGYLYNWTTANKICPAGWHLPSKAEWLVLINYLGGTEAAQSKLLAQNSGGFSAKTGGQAMGGDSFMFLDINGYWWSSTENSEGDKACRIAMGIKMIEIGVFEQDKKDAYSVRCIKDNNGGATGSIKQNTADTTKQNTSVSAKQNVIEKVQQTAATSTVDTAKSFTDARDGKKYSIYRVNKKLWMSKNLEATTFRNGDAIPEVKNQKDWKKAEDNKTPAWCYYENDKKNGATYGKLYNFWAVIDPRGLAPAGWHVSTNVEWTELVNYCGGETIAGQYMKVGEFGFGFDALMGGNRDSFGGFSITPGYMGFYWTSNAKNSTEGIEIHIPDRNNEVFTGVCFKGNGMSVRCVKD